MFCVKNIPIFKENYDDLMTKDGIKFIRFRKEVEQKLWDIMIFCWSNMTSRGNCSTFKLYKETYGMVAKKKVLESSNSRQP